MEQDRPASNARSEHFQSLSMPKTALVVHHQVHMDGSVFGTVRTHAYLAMQVVSMHLRI
jgi:hypothetical protein